MYVRFGSLLTTSLLGLLVACQSRTTAMPDAAAPNVTDDTDTGNADAATSESDAGAPSADGGHPSDASVPVDATDASNDTHDPTAGDAASPDASSPDGGAVPPKVAYAIDGWGQFSDLSTAKGELKFLLPTDAAASHGCWFQNTVEYPYHLEFLRAMPEYATLSVEGYGDLVLTRATRGFYAGVLRLFSAAPHPETGAAGILTYSVYAAGTPSEMLTVAELAAIHERLSTCMSTLSAYLVYLPDNDLALAIAEQSAQQLAQATAVRPSGDHLQRRRSIRLRETRRRRRHHQRESARRGRREHGSG
jgi:hypothetical protein